MQLLSLLTSFDLSKFVEGSFPAPPRTLAGGQSNPDYIAWRRLDQLVFSWIAGSLSDSVLSRLVGCSTALEAWTRLASTYGSSNDKRYAACAPSSTSFLVVRSLVPIPCSCTRPR
ncbi:unnamed protein product [Linum tenue]|uniref:Retrotransposon Copia-like N-terminal domain-containing protein n=1 Tax=Linum tenue TaxID=586396 RepID=A0AAV0NLY6_9ROSI|nr:unnamed protein product [Linum tenue]